MTRLPRSVGGPPLSDATFEQAIASSSLVSMNPGTAPSAPPTPGIFNFSLGDDASDGRLNPLAGMGLTDEQYNMILQNIVNGETFSTGLNMDAGVSVGEKRTHEDSDDDRNGKRSRFEVIE